MPLFVCDDCGCIDNTACGFYWGRDFIKFKDETKNGKALCSECAPTEFNDGSKTEWGQWHNRFPKRPWDGKEEVMNRTRYKVYMDYTGDMGNPNRSEEYVSIIIAKTKDEAFEQWTRIHKLSFSDFKKLDEGKWKDYYLVYCIEFNE